MAMNGKRLAIWGVGLAAAALLVLLAPEEEQGEVAQAMQRGSRSAAASARAAGPADGLVPAVLAIRPRQAADDSSLHFAEAGWTVQEEEASAPAATDEPMPVAAPQAPALPFRYLGRYQEGGKRVLFLMHKEQTLAVKPGDLIGETYRVDAVGDHEATLTYLPLGQEQTLSLSSTEP
jgi:hypothetical protein